MEYAHAVPATMKLLTLGAVLCLSACARSSEAGLQAERIDAITPLNLIATAEARRGQTATLVGYFTWRTDTRALWENRDAHLDAQRERRGEDYDYWAKCVTIYPATDARRLSGRRVRVRGTVAVIAQDDIRSLWTCNAVALENAIIVRE